MSNGNVEQLPVGAPRQSQTTPPQNGNGNGKLLAYRLGRVEKRLENLEGKVSDMSTTLTEIKTQMKNMASKTYVLTWLGINIGLLLLTLLGHLIIRNLGS